MPELLGCLSATVCLAACMASLRCHTLSYSFRIVYFLNFTQRFRVLRYMFAFNARDARHVCARGPMSQRPRAFYCSAARVLEQNAMLGHAHKRQVDNAAARDYSLVE